MNPLDINDYYSQSGEKIAVIDTIIDTFEHQSEALKLMAKNVNQAEYKKAIHYMIECKGHVIICGMGKSGHVGKKISATLASTGTPSFFLHPSEAFHGDLGMITSEDVIILISNSGETDEVLQLIPSLKSFGNKIISITGCETSTMSKNSDATLLLAQISEACPNNLAPTTSTTLTIALGDALAVALMNVRQFQPNDFAKYHPGGALGKRLLTMVEDVMHTTSLPIVNSHDSLLDVISVINKSRKGVAIVIKEEKLVGIITDGDLRRALTADTNLHELKAEHVMTREPKTCYETEKLQLVEELMYANSISSVVVLNQANEISGLVQLFDL